MKNIAIKFILFLLGAAPIFGDNLPNVPIHQFITDPHQGHQIELFTLKPQGTGPFPVIFLLHGHQAPENSPEGRRLSIFIILKTL